MCVRAVGKLSLDIALTKCMKEHKTRKNYICSQCGKAFTTQHYCKTHEKAHTQKKLYMCKQGGRGFTSNSYYKLHERLHTARKPYVCEQCGIGQHIPLLSSP